jgi:hypothetical protein
MLLSMQPISTEDVEKVLDELDRDGLPTKRRSTGYCLVARENRHYPPKHVLRQIYLAKNVEITSPLRGGNRTNRTLRALGYNIEACPCRNDRLAIRD